MVVVVVLLLILLFYAGCVCDYVKTDVTLQLCNLWCDVFRSVCSRALLCPFGAVTVTAVEFIVMSVAFDICPLQLLLLPLPCLDAPYL